MSPLTRRISSTATATKRKINGIDFYIDAINKEKSLIDTIINQTENLLEQKHRRERSGRNSSGNDAGVSQQKQKQISMLEKRLNDALVKFNKKIIQCNALRDRICEKRRDRCLFDQIYTKLERDICVLSRQMRRELEQGRDALEQRKDAEKALAVAKSKLEEDKNALEMDRQQLDRLKQRLKESEDASTSDRLKTTTPCTNSPLVTQVDDNQLNESDEEKQLDAALEQVKKLTCIDDVDELIARVTEIDQNNLSRFQHINLLNDDEWKLQDDIIDAKRMLEKVKSRGLDYNLQQLSEREHAKQEQQALNEKMESLSSQYNSQLELWQKMKEKIAEVHYSLDLTMPDDLLATDGVSESNVLAYLAEIEKKTTEIISALVINDFDEDEGTISPDVRSPANERTTKTKANFNLPSVKDAPGDGDRPWTFEELRSSLCS